MTPSPNATQLQAWQVLPLVPPERGFWSPYSGLDANCGNILLIDLDNLADEGLIDRSDLPEPGPVQTADFDKAGSLPAFLPLSMLPGKALQI